MLQVSRNVLLMSNSTWQIIHEFCGGNLWCLRVFKEPFENFYYHGGKPHGKNRVDLKGTDQIKDWKEMHADINRELLRGGLRGLLISLLNILWTSLVVQW